MGGDAGEPGPPALLGPFQGHQHLFHLLVGVLAALLKAGDPPDVDIIQSGGFESVVERFLEFLGDPAGRFGLTGLLGLGHLPG